jgi:hypothetical protein
MMASRDGNVRTEEKNMLFGHSLTLLRHLAILACLTWATTLTAALPQAQAQVQAAFFVDMRYKTSNANIQVDAAGGMHLAYDYYESVDADAPTYGVYFYCATACEDGANWSGVGFGDQVDEVQLKLTPAAQPRVLFRSRATDEDRNDFFYAACDQSCTDPAQWTVTYLTSNRGTAPSEFTEDTLPQRYFALDPQGRPRFVYNDRVTAHLGTFYAFCDSNCTDAANWYETKINKDTGAQGPYRSENFAYPVLAFTPQGQPRIAADGVSFQDEFYLYYLACDANCEAETSWTSTPLYDRGGGPNVSYDIEIDAQGRPRIAFYQEQLLENQGARLFYVWCNVDCLTGANWQSIDLGLGQFNGQGPDLVLDAADQPHLAYALDEVGGVGYSRCTGNCDMPDAFWQHQIVETRDDLIAAWPVAYPINCEGGLWNGLTPSLALDAGGNPHLAYDATYHARCTYIPETGEWRPWDVYHLVWRAVRVNAFMQP